MPDHGRPSIVQHPLNDACRLIFVPAVRLIHSAHALVSLHLRLDGEIIHVVRLPIPIRQSLAEDVDSFELSAARVIVPNIVNGPHVVFADHRANTFDWRDCRPHAGFGIESVSTAAATRIAQLAPGLALRRVHLPVAGGDIFVGPAHLCPTLPRHAGLFASS